MAHPYFPPTASQTSAYKPQNARVPSTSSDASSSHLLFSVSSYHPILLSLKPAYLPPIVRSQKTHNNTTNRGEACHHQTSFWLASGLQVTPKEQNIFEVTVKGSSCYTSRAALEATFAGRWMLWDNGLASLLWGRTSEDCDQVRPLHLVKLNPGRFLMQGSICQHAPIALKEDLELTWGGRLFLIQQNPISLLDFVWKDIKSTVSQWR